jgi:16S rRNA (cytosine967-C5)-methyltransferase
MVSARAVALHALVALERGRIERLREGLQNDRLDGRDQAFAFELAHGVVRRQRLLDHIVAGLAHRGLPKDAQLRCALQLGAYQLLFVPGMPKHAAVHATVELVKSNRGFANALLRRLADAVLDRSADAAALAPTASMESSTELQLPGNRALRLPAPLPDDGTARLAIVHSLPDFLLERWAQHFAPGEVEQIAAAASAVPDVFLRPKIGRVDAVRSALATAAVETGPAADSRLMRWVGGNSPFATAAFQTGQFVVQDPTALLAAAAVPVKAGDTVVDLCAAPGTKTTFLAEQVAPGGRVFAFDIDPRRRKSIVENVERLRLGEVVTIVADAAQLPIADAVLVDVPCSNTGVLGRRVEVRQRLAESTFAELAELQGSLLQQAIALCRPGGTVVYSTCSIDREENDDVVAAALAAPGMPKLEVAARTLTLPLAGERDGGFFAVLRRPT